MGIPKRIALDAISNQPTAPLPRFKKGEVLCKKQQPSDIAHHVYLVTRIQMIGSLPYYHLTGDDGSYRIIPHTRIDQWRQTTETEKQAVLPHGVSGRDDLPSLFVSFVSTW
jgi:hypothetical protein